MTQDEDLEAGGSFWAISNARAVVRRVWCVAAAIGVLMVVGALAGFAARDAVGVAVGVGLALVNFWFLHTSLRSILGAGYEQAPRGTSLMFLARWFVVGVIAYAIYRSGLASGGGILVGLFAPAVAVMLEAVYQAASAVTHRGVNDTNRGPGL
jgi:hypothetical protein